jgi:hypothetical protein
MEEVVPGRLPEWPTIMYIFTVGRILLCACPGFKRAESGTSKREPVDFVERRQFERPFLWGRRPTGVFHEVLPANRAEKVVGAIGSWV